MGLTFEHILRHPPPHRVQVHPLLSIKINCWDYCSAAEEHRSWTSVWWSEVCSLPSLNLPQYPDHCLETFVAPTNFYWRLIFTMWFKVYSLPSQNAPSCCVIKIIVWLLCTVRGKFVQFSVLVSDGGFEN